MRALIALAVMLLASIGVFVVRGLPATAAMLSAHSELLQREQTLLRRRSELDPMSAAALAALIGERDRAIALADRRVELLSRTDRTGKRPSLAVFVENHELAALSPMTPLGASLATQAAGSAWGDEVLTTILERLTAVQGLVVSELTLANGGRPGGVGSVPGLMLIEAQLVATAGVPEALKCLEALGPDPAHGLPMLTVRTASLRRIEPERWDDAAYQRAGPPVQLTVTLAIYVPAHPNGEG